MTDLTQVAAPSPQPPPAPPLPPGRAGGVFQKFIAPLSFNIGTRPHGNTTSQSTGVGPGSATSRIYRHLPSQTTAHRTGIPIAAIDINKAKTHAILAGQEILKTVHVHDGRMVEDFNLRSGINSYASAYAARSETANHRREYLPAKDVCWSKVGKYDTIIATAAQHGRIALYDVSRLNSSRIELAWIHEHTGEVNKLDFDPTGGYLLLSGSQDKTVRIWDIREPQSVKRKERITVRQPVRDVRWSPVDVGEFALCTENGVVQRWDLRMPTGAILTINAHEKACYAIDWHPDGRHLVSGGFDKYIKVWDLKGDRRQKPAFDLRAPQAILNVRWRPPCWSSDPTEKGQWQSSQLATSYTNDDPRIHIWDLRRRLLPLREHNRYNTMPTDMVWASGDYLWTVGSEGMFTQTDMRYIPLVHDELPTSALGFMPDGTFVAFSEDVRLQRKSSLEDPAAGFLRIPYEKLSGGTNGALSRSLSDDEDEEDGLLTATVRRRVSRSSRSAKSQGNTPPTGDAFPSIVPLDRSVPNKHGLINNDQLGTVSSIGGIVTESSIVEFLAENYAIPATTTDRKLHPTQILDKLQEAFARNANACNYVSLHRMAQSWRILGAVVIPELRDWVDANRNRRLQGNESRKVSLSNHKSTDSANEPQPLALLPKTKMVSSLFKGVIESERRDSEVESSSNMTTPMAKPLLDSSSIQGHREDNLIHLSEAIEPIAPLPPSVMNSHSTAAAASKALLESVNDGSPVSSPEKPRRPPLTAQHHRRTTTDIPFVALDVSTQPQSPKHQPMSKAVSTPITHQSPRMELRKQEDRRAAIRDFRGQQRQLFTLEEPIKSPRYNINERHDSSESFTMFSASIDSSNRTKSFGQSFDIMPRDPLRGHRDSGDWQALRAENALTPPMPLSHVETPRSDSHRTQTSDEDGSMHEDFPMDETSRLDFGSDGTSESKAKTTGTKASAAASMWDIRELHPSGSMSQSDTTASSTSPSALLPEETANAQKVKIYTSNPIRRLASISGTATGGAEAPSAKRGQAANEDIYSKEYVYTDFRPIDFATYEPTLPYAWSALPLICHAIAFDMSEGIASAQFSVHVLMHLHPFFFDPTLKLDVPPGMLSPEGTAERLMRPDLSHRIIEALFLNHYFYLKKLALYRSMTELRNTCMDLGLGEIFTHSASDQTVGAAPKQDPYLLQTSCSHCYSFVPLGTVICQSCRQPCVSCPICLQSNPVQDDTDRDLVYENGATTNPQQWESHSLLWTFCQACGHSAHWTCMDSWMTQPDAEGECPTRGCGCDCGPGIVRQQRIARQRAEAETIDIIRGSRGSGGQTATAKKDPMKATSSPAVDKTRDALRHRDVTRDSSGDELSKRSFGSRIGSRVSGSGLGIGAGIGGSIGNSSARDRIGGNDASVSRGTTGQSFGRRVRLVTPGEEGGDTHSTG